MKKVLIVADIKNGKVKPSAGEMISKAKSLGAEAGVLVASDSVSDLLPQVVGMGSDAQLAAEAPSLQKPSAFLLTRVILEAAQSFQADQVWFAASETSKAVAPRVAARLLAGCSTDITSISFEGDKTVVQRPLMAAKVFQKVEITTPKAVVVVRSGAFDADEGLTGSENRTDITVPDEDIRQQIQEILVESTGRIDLVDAEIVVSCGRGAKDEKGVELIKGLADDLKAGFGSSRALVDSGLMPHESQVGQTGKVVTPNLYFAIGISGAIQHLAGMNASKVIVAVNKDSEAPIFNIADYGIVGDLFEVVPILREEIAKFRS